MVSLLIKLLNKHDIEFSINSQISFGSNGSMRLMQDINAASTYGEIEKSSLFVCLNHVQINRSRI